MKEQILSRLDSVQAVMNSLEILREEHDPFTKFRYYWDVLEFINWMKDNEPKDYEIYDLESDFEILDEFGDAYVNIIAPYRLQYIYRHDDGILNIDVALPKMIREFYDYVINLQESELTELKSDINTGTPTLKDIMNELLSVRVEVSNALSKPAADTMNLAKEVVKEVLNPINPQKKLTKKQQLEADIAKGVAEDRLKMYRNTLKQPK